jgi:hypothetical protein
MSCGGILSPVMTIAGAGILQNTGLTTNPALTSTLTDFTSVPAVGQFTSVLGTASGQLSTSTLTQLSSLGSSVLPALTNAVPSSLAGALNPLAPNGVTTNGLTGLISDTASGIMGSGDLSQFTQIFNAAVGYAGQASTFVSSALNSDSISNTFSSVTGGMNNLVTGGFNQVSESFSQFGRDLANLGSLVDLGNLPGLGDPSTVLRQISSVGGSSLPALEQTLGAAGISSSSLNSLAGGFNDLTPTAQRDIYNAFTQVTGNELDQVKSVLGVTTPNITNMAQLLDPKAIFPNSFNSLTMPTPNGIQPVYTAAGSINTNIQQFLLDPNAPQYTGDDPIVRARLGLPPLPSTTETA